MRRTARRSRPPAAASRCAAPPKILTLTTLYKICPAALWHEAGRGGFFLGAPVDLADGFIHFSTAAQVVETAARHFAGQHDLLLIAIDGGKLGAALKWEPSRGGDLFPHLYGPLPLSAVLRADPLTLGADGRHVFPRLQD